MNSLEKARSVLLEEGKALEKLSSRLDSDFEKAVEIIYSAQGKVIVAGMGKSGLVGRKVAATLSSTGTPALFLHASESLHGDLGVAEKKDVFMILSNSGKTREIGDFLSAVKNIGARLVAITGTRDNQLARNCDASIVLDIEREACPMNLAPTTSTTAMLAIGDALAISLLERRGFGPRDFASLHPAGTLGRKLLLKVKDIIGKKEVKPFLPGGSTVKDALLVMTKTRAGAACIVDEEGRLLGYFTDGDLRRWIQKDEKLLSRPVDDVMTRNPVTLSEESLLIKAKNILRDNKFDNLPVVNGKEKVTGIIDERDIIEAGL